MGARPTDFVTHKFFVCLFVFFAINSEGYVAVNLA